MVPFLILFMISSNIMTNIVHFQSDVFSGIVFFVRCYNLLFLS